MPYAIAAQSVGLSHDLLYNWTDKGLRDEQSYVQSVYTAFVGRLKKAESEAIRAELAGLRDGKAGLWQRHAWILERRWPEHFGQRQYMDVDIHEHPPEVPPEPSTTYVLYIQRVKDRVAVALQASAVDAEHTMVEDGDDQE